ncbi:dienelactone hydrolase family protein [Neolewinella agarilytica]|uniref:carboxylesterase family protein n=1 Tax=Neolewinella agarilytica TaxID=478744 RepID=UPI002356A898|nr:dienelactone hydrolase family protein [Neolewinella agarilytica]
MKKLFTVIFFFLFTSLTQLSAQFTEGSYVLGKDTIFYLLNVPEGFNNNQEKWPLVLFLHGGGEGGHDLEKVKKNGLPRHIAEGRQFPFITLAPQNRFTRGFWDNVALSQLLDHFMLSPRIDQDRVYLTGLSRGGFAAWMLAMHEPERFAALAPVCGAVPRSYDIWIPENLPIWAFHGTDDDLIHPSESVDMIENLRRKKMNPKPKLTLYEGVGHNAWEKAYADPELYKWMLAQKRPKPE